MPTEFEFDVFLSHSSKDHAVVRPLAERLRADGLKVWFDEWVLKSGDSIPAKIDPPSLRSYGGIEEGLEGSKCRMRNAECRIVQPGMSANAFGSDWAQLEAGTFRFRDPLNKQRRSFPRGSTTLPSKAPWRNSLASTARHRRHF
jgi:hypothetical protein